MTLYYREEGGVVTDVRVSPTPGFSETEDAIGIGFAVVGGVFTAPQPVVLDEPVTLTRLQFSVALELKGVTDGLDNPGLIAAVSAASPIGAAILKHAQSFANDDPLIDPVATALGITFTPDDWANARANNFDLIS